MNNMGKEKHAVTVLDLFCGGGGFSEGFHQAGFDVVMGIDNWAPACKTHTMNGLGETRNINLLEVDVDDVVFLKDELEDRYGRIDVIIGSPPCTEFSYAKKGGKGDIEKGMVLVRRHLLFVSVFKPRYWLMENVPRLEHALDKECKGSKERGWSIPYEKLGIPTNRFEELGLKGDSLYIPKGAVFTASDFGACQNRRRFIAGDFPLELMKKQMVGPGTDVSLGGLLERLERNIKNADKHDMVVDPNYPHHLVRRSEIRDYHYDTSLHPMYWEEMRHLKRRHIQYGKMHLPENLDVPARTIMATYNPSSRESLVLETNRKVIYQGKKRKVFRQPTVREVACIQGFPLDFQLVASKIKDRYKLVGNAVPCQLSYALAKSIFQDMEQRMSEVDDMDFLNRYKITLSRQKKNRGRPIISKPKMVVGEAEDIEGINNDFRAKPTKRIRRTLLSSTLRGDSSIVIFENTDFVDNKISGGPFWKSCIQRGVGKKYSQVYLDEISVSQMIDSLDVSLGANTTKALLRNLVEEIDKGIPIVKDEWLEFPGWSEEIEDYLALIGRKRLPLPSLTMFQRMFTEDLPDVDHVIGPIDFFDGIDAIMLRTFSKKRFKHMKDGMVLIYRLSDTDNYPYRAMDSRISSRLENVKVPMVTAMAGLISVHILSKMFENDDGIVRTPYYISLKVANDRMLRWCEYS